MSRGRSESGRGWIPAVRGLLGALALFWGLGASAMAPAAAAGPVAATDPVSCFECGMFLSVEDRFAARIALGGKTHYFCDIGDMVSFLNRTRPKEYSAAVHDHSTGEWIDAKIALYAIDKKAYPTPMGWGVAAFRDKELLPGAPLSFELLLEALR